MPQDVSKNRIALKPEGQTPAQPRSMDANADRLMDEVFGDVERMLETGSEPATELAEPDYAAFKQMKIPQVAVPSAMLQREAAREAAIGAEKAQKTQQPRRPLEKLLFFAACTSLGITLLLWLAGQGRLSRLFGNDSTSQPEAQKASQADVAFADYIQRSLEVIDQKTEERKQNPIVPPPPPTNSPLPVLVPGNLPQSSNRPSVLERVYIPVYPQPRIVYASPTPASPAAKPSPQPQAATTPNNRQAAPATTSKPTPVYGPVAPTSPTPKPSPRPAASATPKPTSSPRPVASASPQASTKATPSLRPVASAPAFPSLSAALPTPTPSQPSPKPTESPKASATPTATATPSPRSTPSQVAAKPSPTVAPDSPRAVAVVPATESQPTPRRQRSTQAYSPTPSGNYVLRGVLVLGDKSAAIFEVNGVSRRIHVGESIGSSGWTLVEINNDNSEAVVRRNGEVRSVFVGQQF